MSKLALKSTGSMSLSERFAELKRERERAPRLAIMDDDESMSEEEDVRPAVMNRPKVTQPLQRQRQEQNSGRKAQPLPRGRSVNDRYNDRQMDRSPTPDYDSDDDEQYQQPPRGGPRSRTQTQRGGRGSVKQPRGMANDSRAQSARESKQLSLREKREKEREMNRERRRANAGDRGRALVQQMENQLRSNIHRDRRDARDSVSPERRTLQEERIYQRELARQKKLGQEMKHNALGVKGANARVTKPAQKQGAIARLQAANSNKKLPANLKKQLAPAEVKGLAGRIQRQPLATRLGARPEIKRLAQAAAAGKAVVNKPAAQQPRTAKVTKNNTKPTTVKAPATNTRERTEKKAVSKADLDAEMDKYMSTAKLGSSEVVWDL